MGWGLREGRRTMWCAWVDVQCHLPPVSESLPLLPGFPKVKGFTAAPLFWVVIPYQSPKTKYSNQPLSETPRQRKSILPPLICSSGLFVRATKS